jgi:DNA-binding transcriptional LysR family regulator
MLEEHLGIRLLNRTTRQQSLTDAGKDFLERTRIVLAELEAAEALAADSGARPRGELRVNAPVTFGAYSLAPLLPAYMVENPEVTVRLTLGDRVVDLVDEGYDCVFRVGRLMDSALMARGLRSLELIACAAPAYLKARARRGNRATFRNTTAWASPDPRSRTDGNSPARTARSPFLSNRASRPTADRLSNRLRSLI